MASGFLLPLPLLRGVEVRRGLGPGFDEAESGCTCGVESNEGGTGPAEAISSCLGLGWDVAGVLTSFEDRMLVMDMGFVLRAGGSAWLAGSVLAVWEWVPLLRTGS